MGLNTFMYSCEHFLCSTYRGLWSVAQWQTTGCTSQLSWVRFPVTAGLFAFLYFRLKISIYDTNHRTSVALLISWYGQITMHRPLYNI